MLIARALPSRTWRAIGQLHIALTVLAVIATGNHFVLDLVAGVATAALGFWVTAIWAARNVRATDQPSLAP